MQLIVYNLNAYLEVPLCCWWKEVILSSHSSLDNLWESMTDFGSNFSLAKYPLVWAKIWQIIRQNQIIMIFQKLTFVIIVIKFCLNCIWSQKYCFFSWTINGLFQDVFLNLEKNFVKSNTFFFRENKKKILLEQRDAWA